MSSGGSDEDGGHDGGNGYGSYGHQHFGQGSLLDIGNYYMKNFVVTPGAGGKGYGGGTTFGGGGGGVLVNDQGPNSKQGQGKGYGGGGSGGQWKSGLEGVVLVEVYDG